MALAEAEWAFHKVLKDELPACLWHEQNRSWMGTWADGPWLDRPWLKLNRSQRRKIQSLYRSVDPSRRSIWSASAHEKLSDLQQANAAIERHVEEVARRIDPLWKPPVQVVLLKVNWAFSKAKLLRDFEEFLVAERKRPWSAAAQYEKVAKTARPGRGRDTGRRLVDIALVRATNAGLNRKQALKLLKPLLEHFEFLAKNEDPNATDGLFSEKNYSTTVKEAKKSPRPY